MSIPGMTPRITVGCRPARLFGSTIRRPSRMALETRWSRRSLDKGAPLIGAVLLVVAIGACGSQGSSQELPPPELPLSWSQAQQIGGQGLEHLEDLRLAGNDAGTVVAVWRSPTAVWANRYSPGAGWEGPRILGETWAGAIELGVDARGNALAVWAVRDGVSFGALAWTRFSIASGWDPPESREIPGLGFPSLAVAPNGRALLAWSDGKNVWARDLDPLTGWIAEELIGSDVPRMGFLSGVGDPQVVLDSQGDATAVWGQVYYSLPRNQSITVRATHRRGDDDWQPARDFPGSRTGSGFLQADESGGALIVWETYNNNQCVRFSPSDGWQGPAVIDAPARFSAAQLAMNSEGTAVLLLSDDDRRLASALFRPATGWSEPSVIVVDTSVYPHGYPRGNLDLRMNSAGRSLALWTRPVGNEFLVWAAEATPWGVPGPVSAPSERLPCASVGTPGARYPLVSLGASGAAVVVWLDDDCNGDSTRVLASRLLSR